MKNFTWLLLLAIFIFDSYCNEGLLSKFHQHGYKVKDVRMELISSNEKYFYNFEIKTYKFNRTTPAINATFKFKIGVKDKVEIVVQVRKFLSNEYRVFPIRFQVNLNKAFEANVGGIKGLTKCGNITTFSFEKDVTYHTCNYVVDETQFPPLIPNGKFRSDVQLLYLNEEIALLYLFLEVYTPVAYPKK